MVLLLALLVLSLPVIIVLIFGSDTGELYGGKTDQTEKPAFHNNYAGRIPPEEEMLERREYSDFEINSEKGDWDYYSGDLARDYDTYYAQVEEAAMMGDKDALDEIEAEFGEEGYLL